MLQETQQDNQGIRQDYHYQVDQQVSVNAYLDVEVEGETVRFQVTNRWGASPEKISKTVRASIEAYKLLRQEFPRQIVQKPAPAPQEPKYVPVDDGGNDLPPVNSFTAERMSYSVNDGKVYFKVMGGKFTQYGVNVWDEVLKAAGIQIDMSNPVMPNINGWRADYSEEVKDGKTRRKVTRLTPPR